MSIVVPRSGVEVPKSASNEISLGYKHCNSSLIGLLRTKFPPSKSILFSSDSNKYENAKYSRPL